MTKINIDEATVAELTAAAQLMQLDVPAGSTRAAIVALIRQSGFEGDEIDIPSKAAPKKAAKAQSEGGPDQAEWIRVLIHKDENNTDDVYLGCNEKSWLARRGVEVELPRAAYESLKNAKRWTYPETEDGIGEPIESQSYPYNILGWR